MGENHLSGLLGWASCDVFGEAVVGAEFSVAVGACEGHGDFSAAEVALSHVLWYVLLGI